MTAGSLARFSLKTSGTFSLLSHRSNQRLASSRAHQPQHATLALKACGVFLRAEVFPIVSSNTVVAPKGALKKKYN